MKERFVRVREDEWREETGSIVFFIYTPCRCADQLHPAAPEFRIAAKPKGRHMVSHRDCFLVRTIKRRSIHLQSLFAAIEKKDISVAGVSKTKSTYAETETHQITIPGGAARLPRGKSQKKKTKRTKRGVGEAAEWQAGFNHSQHRARCELLLPCPSFAHNGV